MLQKQTAGYELFVPNCFKEIILIYLQNICVPGLMNLGIICPDMYWTFNFFPMFFFRSIIYWLKWSWVEWFWRPT